MRCACIDIGSNTTRLLVAEDDGTAGVRELAAARVFTAIGAEARPDGVLPAAKIAEVVDVVAAQMASARRHGADPVRTVATAAIRRAPNREILVAALAQVGIELEILSARQEARLAFAGAIAAFGATPDGSVAVVDVGGGSTEVVVGLAGDRDPWSVSLPVGSSSLTRACVRHDPPSAACLAALAATASEAFAAVSPPAAALALAVGGSATSLLLLAGAGPPGVTATLDERSLIGALAALTAEGVADTALRLGLHPERVRVLPAGITLLAEASRIFTAPLRIARGGLREGIILDLIAAGPGGRA